MKNIGIYVPSISRNNGGSSTILDIASRLKNLGCDVSLYSILGKLDNLLYRPSYFNPAYYNLRTFPHKFILNRNFNALKKILNHFAPQPKKILHDLIIDATLLKKEKRAELSKKSKIILNHAGSPSAFKDYFLKVESIEEYLEYCSGYDGVIFQSKNQMNEYLNLQKDSMKTQKIFCCVPPANDQEIKKILHRRRLNNSKIRIICVGSLQERKNQIEIIYYANMLRNKTKDFEFILAGNIVDKSYYKKICLEISKNNLQKHIKIVGFRKDYLSLIYNADFLVHPSLQEGVSRVLREAMALGKLSISYALDGTKDLSPKGTEIMLCNDRDSISNSILEVIKDNKLLKNYENNAFKKYWSEFSEENYISKLEDYINEFK